VFTVLSEVGQIVVGCAGAELVGVGDAVALAVAVGVAVAEVVGVGVDTAPQAVAWTVVVVVDVCCVSCA
jgi:hypothetical protein